MPTALTSYTPQISVELCGKCFTLHRAASLEELWDAMSDNATSHDQDFDDERLPYWTELWPSSIVLAELLWQKRNIIAHKACLDVGCGLGLTALVGQMLHAKVLAFDYEEQALHFAKKNRLVNDAHLQNTHNGPHWLTMDWRKPAIKKHSMDFVWGGDIMYERRFAYNLLNFIDYSLNEQGRAWIAEPCRSVYENFKAELLRRRWNAKIVHKKAVDAIYAQAVPVTVQVWEIWR